MFRVVGERSLVESRRVASRSHDFCVTMVTPGARRHASCISLSSSFRRSRRVSRSHSGGCRLSTYHNSRELRYPTQSLDPRPWHARATAFSPCSTLLRRPVPVRATSRLPTCLPPTRRTNIPEYLKVRGIVLSPSSPPSLPRRTSRRANKCSLALVG